MNLMKCIVKDGLFDLMSLKNNFLEFMKAFIVKTYYNENNTTITAKVRDPIETLRHE